ncbi:MAG: hypothetical protein ACOH2T_23255 [Pseudomonas sp.]
MSDKMRDEFEAAWAEAMRGDDPAPGRKPLRSQIEPERYRGDAANFAWRWWQRSRDALVIELPEPSGISADGFGYQEACARAITTAGLKVKP